MFSSLLRRIGAVILVVDSPSFTMTTRFWHLAHQSSPLLSLNMGEAQAGHERSVRVAPCRSRLTMAVSSSFFVGKFYSLTRDFS